jgi:predicted dithiol-disulfide oxidoreductase (DUF899 family)
MKYHDIQNQIEAKYEEIAALRKKQIEISKSLGLEEVANYIFTDTNGSKVVLEDLFGTHDELILIHNMGKNCPYCTLWADGFIGMYRHITTRCGFVLASPNSHQELADFATMRNWTFPCVSAQENSFSIDMGFQITNEEGKNSLMPGYTTFVKKEGKIFRVACDTFGPGDFYAPIWSFIEMLHHTDKPWRPIL